MPMVVETAELGARRRRTSGRNIESFAMAVWTLLTNKIKIVSRDAGNADAVILDCALLYPRIAKCPTPTFKLFVLEGRHSRRWFDRTKVDSNQS
jgi:hypothetical protein